jgi:hypothetical protein
MKLQRDSIAFASCFLKRPTIKRFLPALLCAFFASAVFAQELPQDEQPPEEPRPPIENNDGFVYSSNQRGDQFIKINLMVDLPIKPDIEHLQVGGAGTISYMRFLNPWFLLGGDLSFGYNVTVGSNVFTFVPILFKGSYQFTYKKFEFPLTLGLGVAFENYLTRTYFGLAVKPEIGAYWRIVPEWSFGIHYGVYFLPQWYSNPANNYLGIIQDLGLSGRYHF